MPGTSSKPSVTSNLETELYLLIAKFLSSGCCKKAAEVLRKEIEEHQLLPKRYDWLGNVHFRSFIELEPTLSQLSDDHLLKICARIGPILDKEVPPAVPGLQSLLGVGRQSLLRVKEEKPKLASSNLLARKYGVPFYPSPSTQVNYPPNITQVLLTRESSGPISSRHILSSKLYARQQLYRRILGHLSSVYCVLFDHTGKYIFTGADDLLLKVWSATDGRLLASLRGHSAEITDMAVNSENTLLASGSCDKTIRVWCLRTTAPVAVLCGHTGMVTSLQFCPYPKSEERYLISTGNDGCVCFWRWNSKNNVFNPQPLKFTERNKAGAQMICSSFSSGGVFLATGSTDHSVRVYNIAGISGPEKILEKEVHTDRVDSLQFSNSGCRFISGSKDGTAQIWRYEKQSWHTISLRMTTRLPKQPDETEDTKAKLRVTMVGWTLDDSRVITAVSDFSVKVWDSNSGALCHILKGHDDEVFVLEAHPTDPRIILSSGHDGRIMLWDIVTGTVIKNYFNLIEGQGHGAVFDCKFSPDGNMFASTDSHGHLCIFGFGSNDRYKKVPEEQFFHTDYRPLIRDINHHVLDEQTQCAPHLLPPPFLVDIDGNPYPPNLQRLVPGREHCKDSQLIPYVTVSNEGEAEILEPVRPADGTDRPTIDDMIEMLQMQQVRNGVPHHDAVENSNESHQPFSPRSLRNSNSDRNVSESFSPRSAQRGQAGHSRVGMRRTGDIEGVRQSVGNWQSRGNQSEVPAWTKRVVVKPMKPSLLKCYQQRRTLLADNELAFYNREKKRREIPISLEASYNKQEVRQRYDKGHMRLRSRRGEHRSPILGDDYENPDAIDFTTSSESETDQNDWDNSSGEESGSGEHSDWTADAGVCIERPRRVLNNKPSTSGLSGSSGRRRRQTSSSDNVSSDEEQNEAEEETTPKKKKKPISKPNAKASGKKFLERFERYRPPEWLTDVMPHKVPYVPQIGDEVVYFRQGHELYVQAVKRARIYDIYMRSQPWRKMNLREQEVAKIVDISFENHPPRLCCLKLELLNPANKQNDSFIVKYHDMADVIDFIILKQNYDQAMIRNWKPGDRFRSAIDKAWWLGTIKAQKPLNENFPDSMFQCFVVKWDNGEKEQMSPWDFEPIDADRMPEEEGGSLDITPEEQLAMMYVPAKHEWSRFGQECDIDRITRGLTRVMEFSIAESFSAPVDLNQYPTYAMYVEYPMDLGTIRERVQNRFYRRLDAIKFDIQFIEINANKFNEPGSKIVKQAKCLVDLCMKFINAPDCHDPMVLYQEMMEAKQSRSQDSQSELDVLCSESDSDYEHYKSARLKKRRRREQAQVAKRLKLEAKYTSDSWKQECLGFLNYIFQVEDSEPFRYPVSLLEFPNYRNIIDSPMDLSKVKEKLDSNQYSSPIDFCKDMRLIFQNSRTFNTNKRSKIYSMTIRLSALFEEHIRSIVSDWRSAVKYEEKVRNNQYVSNRRKPLSVIDRDRINCKSSNRLLNNNASTSRYSSGFSSSSHRKDDLSRPGPSRVTSSETNVKNNGSTSYAETNDRGHRKKKKKIIGEKVTSFKVSGLHNKKHENNSMSNGVIKKLNIKRGKKVPELQTKNVNAKEKVQSMYAAPNKKKTKIELSSPSEFEDDALSSESEAVGNSDEDYELHTKENKNKTLLKRKFQLRPRPKSKLPHPLHQTRSASLRLLQEQNSLPSEPLKFHQPLTRRSRSSTPPASPRRYPVSGSRRPIIHTITPIHTRSMKLLKSTTDMRTLRNLRSHTVQNINKNNSDDSESESPASSVKNETNSDSNSASISRNYNSENDCSNMKERSSSSSDSENQVNSIQNTKKYPSRRLTRITTRDSTKASHSALDTKGNKRKISPQIQTRNRGQRTVRYLEETDDEDNFYYENSESESVKISRGLSISSRGRLRKLSRHAKPLFSD